MMWLLLLVAIPIVLLIVADDETIRRDYDNF